MDLHQEFIEFAVMQGVLRFGTFITKAGRQSPYFFNAGLFHEGASIARLASFYAKTLLASNHSFDMLFGPAYKGIPLVTATAIALSEMGRDVSFAFNRKEAKDHGEGGTVIGAPLKGKVVIVDDVISAGTSVRESVEIIRAAGATPSAVLIALDRMERGQGSLSAVEEVQQEFGIPVLSVVNLADLLDFLKKHSDYAQHVAAVENYRSKFGGSYEK